MSNSSLVLLYGLDSLLLETRQMVLESAGYRVLSTNSFEKMQRFLREEPVGLVILCHTVQDEKLARALNAVRALRVQRPGLRVLMMQNESSTDIVEMELTALCGPREMLHSVKRILCQPMRAA